MARARGRGEGVTTRQAGGGVANDKDWFRGVGVVRARGRGGGWTNHKDGFEEWEWPKQPGGSREWACPKNVGGALADRRRGQSARLSGDCCGRDQSVWAGRGSGGLWAWSKRKAGLRRDVGVAKVQERGPEGLWGVANY